MDELERGGRRIAAWMAVGAVAAALAACGGPQPGSTSIGSRTSSGSGPGATAGATAAPLQSLVPHQGDLLADLHSKPVPIPLRFRIPSIGVDIPMDAVGLDRANAMDAPGVGDEKAPADDPIWNTGFWYRGGAEPGQPGVATIAGHLDDSRGRPAAFWNLRKLQVGDIVEIDDQRTDAVIRFRITDVHDYTLAQSGSPAVLARLFGPEAARARPPLFPADGISRLSLVTCAGTYTRGEYDHRYMVFAERLDGPGSPAQPATPPPVPASTATGGG